VLTTVDDIAVGLVDHITAHGLAVVRLHVLIESEHGERSERMWYRSDGFGVRSIVESARWQLDAWIQHDAPTSGVVALRIAPEHMVVNAGRQAALWGGERDGDAQAQRAIRRVADVNGAESITLPAWRGGRDPARVFELVRSDAVDLEHLGSGNNGDNGVAVAWRGALPSPAPALVFDGDTAPEVDVLDADGRAVSVDARHAMSSDPVTVCVHHIIHDVVAWAGPWPVEERWWDARRARRAVRMQLLVRERTSPFTTRAVLVVCERRTWRLSAWYA
jgi:protein ImuB